MKRQWFSDAKDLVKWGVLESLGRALDGTTNIVWVAMLTPDFQAFQERQLVPEGAISQRVYDFFRDPSRIAGLANAEGLRITPVMQPFVHRHRESYFEAVCALVTDLHEESGDRLFVFLDPDTGIRAGNGGNPERYVLPANLSRVYASLRRGDSLFVYQHAPQGNAAGDDGWLTERRGIMAQACGVAIERIAAYRSPALTRELAILELETTS